jgi:hypothetical protein
MPGSGTGPGSGAGLDWSVHSEHSGMNRIIDYLERAVVFDRLATEEHNPEFKDMFEKQAHAYRRLAAHGAKRFGVELPEISN